MFYEISFPLSPNTYTYPGDPAFTQRPVFSIPHGDEFNLSLFSFGSHTGTHLDTPRHFFAQGKSISDYPANAFCGTAWVISVTNASVITRSHLASYAFSKNAMVLFRTNNAHFDGVHPLPHYTGLSPEAAQYLVDQGVGLVGIDYITVEPEDSTQFSVHQILLGNNVVILETLRLGSVPDGVYHLTCVPLGIQEADACPVRAFLTSDEP